MKIGFPNNPRRNIIEEIEWIGKNGFDFVDLFLEEDQAVPEKIDLEEVKRLLEKYRLETMGHTAWYLPIGSPMKILRETAITETRRYFEVFAGLEVKFVTIHANWPSGMFSTREGIGFQVSTLRRIVDEAKKYGINIIYEPIDTWRDDVKSVSEILKQVPELYLHIDIGHANLFGRNPEQFIRKFHKKIRHIHLHDNDGDKDLHLPMGAGNIDWASLIKTLKEHYDGTITLEIFSKDKDYVLLSRDKLKKLWLVS